MIKMNNLTKGLLVLVAVVAIVIGLYGLLMIGGLVIGSIAGVATGGDITISTAMNTSLAGLEGDYITDSEAVAGNSGLIIALVAIVVLVAVFGFNFSFGRTGKKGVE